MPQPTLASSPLPVIPFDVELTRNTDGAVTAVKVSFSATMVRWLQQIGQAFQATNLPAGTYTVGKALTATGNPGTITVDVNGRVVGIQPAT